MAAWGTARALARAVMQETASRAMDRALQQGGPFDEKLSALAEKEITPALLSEQSEPSQEGEEDNAGDADGGGRAHSKRSRKSEGRTAR